MIGSNHQKKRNFQRKREITKRKEWKQEVKTITRIFEACPILIRSVPRQRKFYAAINYTPTGEELVFLLFSSLSHSFISREKENRKNDVLLKVAKITQLIIIRRRFACKISEREV